MNKPITIVLSIHREGDKHEEHGDHKDEASHGATEASTAKGAQK